MKGQETIKTKINVLKLKFRRSDSSAVYTRRNGRHI